MAPGYGLIRNTSAQSIWRMHLMTCIYTNPWSPSHLEQNETTDTCQTALGTRSKQNRRLVNMPFGHEGERKQGDSRVRQDQPQHCEKPQAMPLTHHVRVTDTSKHTPNAHWCTAGADTGSQQPVRYRRNIRTGLSALSKGHTQEDQKFEVSTAPQQVQG